MANTYAPIFQPIRIDLGNANPINTLQVLTNAEAAIAPSPTGISHGIGLTNDAAKAAPGNPFAPTGNFVAEKVWNSVWNDYADLQLLRDKLIPGKCYIDTADGAMIASKRCQLSVIGIASDTFAHVVGLRQDIKQVPIAVSGWVLAYVDKEYPCGTPLTNNENGDLTEMNLEEKRNYPERLVAIYKRKELDLEFGTDNKKIRVDNRHWVKVK